MGKYENNIVYHWATRCSSENCIPPSVAFIGAKKRGYKLWVVLDYYDKQIIGVDFDMPIYSIKNSLYKTDYCPKYKKLFYNEIGWIESKDKWGRFLLFRGNQFVGQENSISDFD